MRKNGLRESTTKFCSENECSRGFYARGLCHKHYQAWRRTDSFTRVVFEERTCTLDGCEKKHHAAGYCQEHLDRLGRHGDPRKAIFRDGTSITKEGYRFIWRRGHPNAAASGRIFEHRVVMY